MALARCGSWRLILLGQEDNETILTTFYGSLLSTMFFLPIAGKLRVRTVVEVINLEIVFEGAISILDNNNPLMVYEKLSSYIPRRIRHPMKKHLGVENGQK